MIAERLEEANASGDQNERKAWLLDMFAAAVRRNIWRSWLAQRR